MKKFQTLLSIVVIIVIISATSCEHKSGKRQKEMPAQTQSVENSPSKNSNDKYNGEEIIGKPISVCYQNEFKEWDLVLDVNGNLISVDVEKPMAMKIMEDTTIVTVKVKGYSVTILREEK
ncbi:MAG TPA: hypothetical protein VK153_01360 [Candidatus Paceibacterota bacterium]|nr:hypothetical protein [Candidatus Paceibacterota bacterium]